MKALIWNSPWIAQGDILFYKNCFIKHLVPQANLLNEIGYSVDVVTHDLIKGEASKLNSAINRINLSFTDIIEMVGVLSDPSKDLYESTNSEISVSIQNHLIDKLASEYDVIMLWETPVPFLEKMFPESLIIHQMPGAFCRAPYPHLVTFDPVGLYKHGSLYKHFDQIVSDTNLHHTHVDEFKSLVKDSIAQLSPFSHQDLNPYQAFKELTLLPLQTSGHYAFLADTPYISQADYLVDILSKTELETGLVVTQYVTPKVKDTVLNDEVLNAIKEKWPNLIFKEEFDTINSISQYLLPLIDKVVSCSSSIALQSMVWNKDIIVPHETFIKRLSIDELNLSGYDKENVYSSVLDFIIRKQQPLAHKVLNDGKFLSALLEEMLSRKRSGKTGLDLYVDFDSIDSNYFAEMHEKFNVGRASRDIKNANEKISLLNADAAKLERIIKREGLEHVTFDVFDTLINRPVETPADAYKFMETLALDISGGITEDFYKVRLIAEVETRKNSDNGEITLDEIYAAIKEHYQLDSAIINKIMAAEIELEISLIQTREAGKRLWDAAIRTGRPISIISDMYLPHSAVQAMLEKAGYKGYQKLYVSSSYGVRKKEGGLFDIVLEDIGIQPNKIIHVGDNVAADIEMPKSKGMLTFRIVRALDRMRGNKYYKQIFNPRRGVGEKPRSIIAGLIANKLFDNQTGHVGENSLFMDSPYNVGYAALGPMLTAYMQWISRQAKRDGIDTLYFLSREGWLLKQIYDAVNQHNEDFVPSSYLYCSRRAVRVASIKNINDVLNIASQPFSSGVTLGELLNYRFGLTDSDVSHDSINECGFSGKDERLEANNETKVKFSRFCRHISHLILAQAEIERNVYMEYLESTGIISTPNAGIVDIGWKANMQASLGSLLDKKFNGYYYATLQGAEAWLVKGHDIKAFAGDFITVENRGSVVNNRHFVEFLTCHTEKSLVSMSRDSMGNIVKNFRDEPSHGMRSKLIDEIHNGAISFARDMSNRFGKLVQQSYADWSIGEKVFAFFVNSPTVEDAQIFVGQAFEDSFGGVARKYVIGNSREQLSVFNNGANVIYPAINNEAKKPKKKPQTTAGLAKNANQNSVVKYEPIAQIPKRYINLERFVFKRFSNKKKYDKYLKDRDAFFLDSKIALLNKWYNFTLGNKNNLN